MKKLITLTTAAVAAATAAYALPGDVLVVSDKEVAPDEAAGFYYLGICAEGYLYCGSASAVSRAAPYRTLDREAETKDYYIVWAPGWVNVKAEAFAHLGTSVRLSNTEILVGLEWDSGPGALRAVERRIELRELKPVTPVDVKVDAEEPPKKKDPVIEAAVNTITEAEYAGYIRTLQDFKTRSTDTKGNEAARNYIRDFFSAQGLEASLFEFDCMGFLGAYYAYPAGRVYVLTDHVTFKRSSDNGLTWDTVYTEGTNGIASSFWYDRYTGFVGAYNNRISKTTDGGDTWETITFAPGYPEYKYKPVATYFATPQIGWLGGEYSQPSRALRGFVLKTTDGGQTWVSQTTPEDFRVSAMGFFDTNRGWAGGCTSPGRLFYTANGGAAWQEGSIPGGVERIEDIAAVGPTEAWAAVDSNNLLHTTDGLTWSWVNTGAARQLYRVEFPDNQYGYAGGYELVATDNGGANWRTITGLPVGVCYALSFADRNHGILGERYGQYLCRTDDGGASFVNLIDNVDLSGENVIGERRGSAQPEKIVIIGGHFDSTSEIHPSLAPGADDNASGFACAMTAARALKDIDFRRTVRYVAFGDEEFGKNGSKAYADHCAAKGETIVAVLNADMVAYDEEGGSRDDYAVAYDQYDWLFGYLKAVGGLYGNNLTYESGNSSSDHRAFWDAGYAAIGVIEGSVGPGGSQQYPYYHTTEDTFEKLHPALGVRFARDYAAMFAHLASFEDIGVHDPPPGGVATVPQGRPFAVYPNPYCYASTTAGVSFVGLRAPAKVEIYDLAGRRVTSAAVPATTDEFVWNPGGEALAPGVYLYRVEGEGQKEAGKLVVAK